MMDEASYSKQVRKDLDILGFGRKSWVRPRDGVFDVVIVGGGQSGLGAAFGLIREGVSNILILDENPKGEEGPWGTYARMITLRTPKELLSIDLGVPSLSFRAWWSALHGEESWRAIDKIPREDWLAYLKWYRSVLDLPVENDVKLERVEPMEGGGYTLQVSDVHGPRALKARKVILATGIQGGGEWHTPEFIKEALPKSRYAHTSEMIDFAALTGKKIAILGNGASAFDNAQHALNHGAGQVDVFVRRSKIPTVNPIRYMEQTGLVPRFAALPDPLKYDVISSFMARAQPPTNDTFQRSAAWPNFSLHLGAPWDQVKDTDQGVELTTPKGVFVVDYLILSTGLVTDHAIRPELSLVADKIARWSDVYSAPEGTRNALLDAHPYLGDGFEFTPRAPADAGDLRGLYAFNYSALLSHGLSAAALTGLGYAIPRLTQSVANQLFMDDHKAWIEDYHAYDEPEFVSEWAPSVEAGAAV